MYELLHDSDVVEQVAALPEDALLGYADVLDVLQLVPWRGRPYNDDKPDGAMRECVFGDGRGTVTYLILEDPAQVHILLVQWVA